jgi:hypothetical protein
MVTTTTNMFYNNESALATIIAIDSFTTKITTYFNKNHIQLQKKSTLILVTNMSGNLSLHVSFVVWYTSVHHEERLLLGT